MGVSQPRPGSQTGLSPDGSLLKPVKELKDKFALLPAFLKERGLAKQHVESFDFFINQGIKAIIRTKDNNRVAFEADSNFYLRYLDIRIGAPITKNENSINVDMEPMHCRLRDQTYAAPIKVDVEYVKGKHVVTRTGANAVEIGRLPLMLRSERCVLRGKTDEELIKLGECPLDPGGYFIVRGTEKVILIQEQLSKNRVLVDLDRTGNIAASVTSHTTERKVKTNLITKHGRLLLQHNAFTDGLNVIAVLKAMGIESDQEALQLAGCQGDSAGLLVPTIQECKALGIFTQRQALVYLGSKVKRSPMHSRSKSRMEEARDILANIILCHVPVVRYQFNAKAVCVGYMIKRVVAAMLDPTAVDDRDYYGNKRLELAGNSLSLLFEDLFKHMNDQLRRQAEATLGKANRNEDFDISRCIRSDIITAGLESAISSGNWTIKRFRMERRGMTQVLNRLSFMASMGMMTRINSQFEKTRKVSGPRSLQPSQWGMVCPADTPEGESCGLDKNLALTAFVTSDADPGPIQTLAYALGVQPLAVLSASQLHAKGRALVMLDGIILGVHQAPKTFVGAMRTLRRAGRLSPYISLALSHDTVSISADGGRICRPLIVCQNGRPRLTDKHLAKLVPKSAVQYDWRVARFSRKEALFRQRDMEAGNGPKPPEWTFVDLLRRGLVECVDVNEENDCLVALYERDIGPKTTHLEIEPFTILGIVAGLIPFPHHNQSPRNTYQCAMGKQAMGNIAFNQLMRMDTLLYLLVYPQRPLLTTQTIQLVRFDELGAGQNATVAVMSYSGYDIEDALIMNRASLDRGFGRCMLMRKHGTVLKRYPNRTADIISMPATPRQRDHLLESDGLAAVGEVISPGDVYIHKEVPLNTRDVLPKQDQTYKRQPQSWKGPEGEQVIVDKVLLANNDEGNMVIKALMRHTRRPELGDKFSSRHGQKGVVGNIVAQRDMPFSERGICPDIIMNPHGFPSRMTVGKMIELLGSKAGVLTGKYHLGTAFGEGSAYGGPGTAIGGTRTHLADNVDAICQTLVEKGFSYSGKDFLTSGITGEPLEAYIFMGPIYYQKLKHMVVDKMHARARGPRVTLTRQPTEGRARDGGLRLGEMERDCLIAYGASSLLLERLMISSDQFQVHVCEHCGLMGYFDATLGCAVCPSTKDPSCMSKMLMPYACKLLFQELQSMNIAPRLILRPADQ